VTATDIQRTIDAVWRIESPKLIARLARLVRDVGLAEELAQDAFVAALEQWPESGVPPNPGGWLMSTAKHRAIDTLRRNERLGRKYGELAQELATQEQQRPGQPPADMDLNLEEISDDMLRLVFTACHPVLSPEARVALTLRLLGGLTTAEIARAYLVSESTVAQRIVRAKRTLTKKQIPFEIPQGPELGVRLASVLEVIYLIFNEGYSATAGEDWMRPDLCEDAVRLARMLAGLMPKEPEVHGLVALLEIQASRTAARTNSTGEPVLLLDQDRRRWDRLLIRRGLSALDRAEELGGQAGRYTLQAAIAASHARAPTAEETDWTRIAALYWALMLVAPSPVVELNRAVAVSRAVGPAAALEIVDALRDEPTLTDYHLLSSVRGDLLARLDRRDEARAEFERAATLTDNAPEQTLLRLRAAELAEPAGSHGQRGRHGTR